MGRLLTEHEESLAVELYQSNNEDVDIIVAELFELHDKYILAREKATIVAIADKFEVGHVAMGHILRRRGISRHECSVRVFVSKKTVSN